MDIDNFRKLTHANYSRNSSAKFQIAVLTKPPQIVLMYDRISYRDPDEVTDYWLKNPDDDLYMSHDNYCYFNKHGCSGGQSRMKNIGSEISRIISSEVMQDYLNNIVDGPRLQLLPKNWEPFLLESGAPKQTSVTEYINICYNIPNEEHYQMTVNVLKKEKKSDIKLEVFITHPRSLSFDGDEHINYPVYLSLAGGKIFDSNMLKTTSLMLEKKNH
jgi:hypothetical protein